MCVHVVVMDQFGQVWKWGRIQPLVYRGIPWQTLCARCIVSGLQFCPGSTAIFDHTRVFHSHSSWSNCRCGFTCGLGPDAFSFVGVLFHFIEFALFFSEFQFWKPYCCGYNPSVFFVIPKLQLNSAFLWTKLWIPRSYEIPVHVAPPKWIGTILDQAFLFFFCGA